MAKISLRVYNREIEALIDRGQTEEAIAHCKFILKTYPKHLETYRLLGKAFLESQRYSEAADILQRILSVQPDDFVSQIGMSIIREDEGNLDAAIYHMERAFEIQPSNAAIQDELRRLYGRRDGIEPPKLRLTRGALVRMYARGDLYRQAIAESRAALKEDPQRLDLEIVLARMYFQTGQKAEAAEISSRLITKLPYCFEANRILAEVLPETSRAEDARQVMQKLVALDPYLGYSEVLQGSQQSPDNAVSIDRLEWTPSLETDQQPAWARSLGINLEKTPTEEMPQWMTTIQTGSSRSSDSQVEDTPSRPFSEELSLFEDNLDQKVAETPAPAVLTPDPNIPDWMQTAGWKVSDQPVADEPSPFDAPPDLDSATPAELPGWLKEMTPNQALSNDDQRDAAWATPDFSQNFTETAFPAQEVSIQPIDSEPAEAFPNATEELPDWLKAPATPPDDGLFAIQNDDPLPDWLMNPIETPTTFSDSSVETLPQDWLTPKSDSVSAESDQIAPDLLNEATPPVPDQAIQPQFTAGISLIKPQSPATPTEPEPTPETSGAAPDLNDFDQAMAWLESLAAKQGAEEETLLTRPDDRVVAPPDWVAQAAQDSVDSSYAPSLETSDAQNPPVISLTKAHSSQTEDSISDNLSPAPIEDENLTTAPTETEPSGNWLSENPPLDSGQPAEAAIAQETIPPADEIQQFEDTAQPSGELISSAEVPNYQEALPSEIEISSQAPVEQDLTTEMDSAFAWLESLAAKQGAEAGSLLVTPEDRIETPPDWVQQQAVEEAESFIAPNQQPARNIPEWIRDGEETPDSIEAVQPNEEDLPDWLKETESSPQATSAPVSEIVDSQNDGTRVGEQPQIIEGSANRMDPLVENDEPTWFRENAQEQNPVSEPPPVDHEEGKPTEPQRKTGFGYTRPLPSWLVGVSTPSSAPESAETLPSEPEPALPDWLKTDENPQTNVEAVGENETVDETGPALPDWLNNLDSEPEEDLIPGTPVLPEVATPKLSNMEISSDPQEMVEQAQSALAKGHIELSLTIYTRLIQQQQHLDETIHDLRDALYRFPVDSAIWQTLGDAYFQNNRIQDALDAYTKAEDFLK